MKKIVLIFVFLAAFSCSKSISQISVVKAISDSPQIQLPYGDKDVLYEFPADWTFSKTTVVQDSLYNKLSRFLFEDIENPARNTFKSDYPEAKALLAKEFVPSAEVKNKKAKVEFKSAKVFDEKKIQIISVVYQGKIDCPTCEYPESQTQNVLVSVKDGKIIDKLPISYSNGSDLGQSTRYFFIDSNKVIHLKDFNSDESGVTFAGYSKYQVSPEGKFIRLK